MMTIKMVNVNTNEIIGHFYDEKRIIKMLATYNYIQKMNRMNFVEITNNTNIYNNIWKYHNTNVKFIKE